ncbi:MAG: hypothetical protein IJH07_07450 [Ruminococcus sp.]|nr:hypothetical protein [Ruminococcus sp.]
MKKFVIISAILLLIAGSAFGYALYRFVQVNDLFRKDEPAATEAVTEAAQSADATEAEKTKRDDTAVGAAEIFAAGKDQATAALADMTDEELTGQLLIGVCADSSTAAAQMSQYSLAGMLFVSDNFQGMEKEEITASLTAAGADLKIKPILAAQEEGGMYTTISDLPAFSEYDFNSPRTEFDTGGLQAIQKAEDDKTTMLKSVGFNMNLAPVIDLASSGDQIMYSRSVSDDVETASSYAEYAAKFDQAKGVSIVLKHFPGYGTIPDSADTGVGAVVDDRPAETIRATDYTPFKRGIAAGAHCVMMSNVVVQDIDQAHTAAFSPTLHNELRNTVGFTGLIMTDIIDGADYSSYADGNKPAVQAVLAGNNLILVRDYAAAYNDILAAVKDGTISETQLKDAVTRVLAYKYTVGIMK